MYAKSWRISKIRVLKFTVFFIKRIFYWGVCVKNMVLKIRIQYWQNLISPFSSLFTYSPNLNNVLFKLVNVEISTLFPFHLFIFDMCGWRWSMFSNTHSSSCNHRQKIFCSSLITSLYKMAILLFFLFIYIVFIHIIIFVKKNTSEQSLHINFENNNRIQNSR